MGTLEMTVVLVVAIAGLGWVVVQALRGSAPPAETSARADTFGAGAGYAAEQVDNIRNVDR